MTAAFILCNWLLRPLPAIGVYGAAYLLYLAAKRKGLLASVRALRALMTEKEAEA